MATGFDALTEKEKQTLRLLLRGHDAKSVARAAGLSVHTVNERLRDARRKLAVSSSREAARLLLEREGDAPERLGDMRFGDDATVAATQTAAGPTTGSGRRIRPGRLVLGACLMVLTAALLAFVAVPQTVSPPANPPTSAADAAVEAAALNWLTLLDGGRWDESYAATGAAFRKLNTRERWAAASERVRAPLGAVTSRSLLSHDYTPAPPEGYDVVRFRTDFANKAGAVETVTLDREDGVWRVVGVTVG